MTDPGTIVVVATPIGHLDDMSPRALAALESADLIACEDTRRTGLMMHRLGINKRPLLSLHDHNERRRVPDILERVSQGLTIALVSDAGTPLVSDPGYRLIRQAIAQGLGVEAIPGPSAPIVSLVLSGLPPHPFTFLGFAPPKKGARQRFLKQFADLGHTLILFEAPHRLLSCLADVSEIMGDRGIAVARELTKLHQEVVRGSVSEVLKNLASRDKIKGETTVVIEGAG